MLFSFGYVSEHWIWVALVVIFVVIEVCTLGLTTIWFALAAFVMIFLSFLPIPFVYQFIIFLVISAVLLIFTRPVAVKKFKSGKVKTNVDSLAGMNALVTREIGEFNSGEVKLNGQIWTARSEDSSVIKEGIRCEVVRIEGVQAIVRPIQ
ncbi:MAG: NfeD family protein [Treponema sp.]|jgi:membrane protein implicated in regulation of membrane protease activity|nr:NfeD family protein [Treponema sp.]